MEVVDQSTIVWPKTVANHMQSKLSYYAIHVKNMSSRKYFIINFTYNNVRLSVSFF